MQNTKAGFTLIELLVVVLIIGILAAVALPQYQKAVWKTRNAQLKALVSTVAKAQQSYFLANGSYATGFNELDIDLPLDSSTANPCNITHTGTDAIRATPVYYVVLNPNGITTAWKTGPYKCTGFVIFNTENELLCTEARHGSYNLAGKFCKEIEKGTEIDGGVGWQLYKI